MEDKQDFDLRLVSLKNQITTTGKTTLLGDKYKRYYRDRKLIYSLRLLRRADPVDKPSVVRLEIREIPGNRNNDGPRAWRDYIFRGYGASENNPAVYIKPKAEPERVYNPIPQLNLQNHATQLSRALGAVVSETSGFSLGPPPGFAVQNDDTIDLLLGSRPNFAVMEDEPVALPVAAKRRVRGFDETTAAPPNISQPEPPKFNPAVGISSSYFDDFESILPPRPAPISTPSPPPTTRQSQSGIVRTTRRVRTQDPVPEEKQQEKSEQDTRILRSINSQKKPKKEIREYSFKEYVCPQCALHFPLLIFSGMKNSTCKPCMISLCQG